MALENKPATIRTTPWKESIKIHVLSRHLKLFPRDEKTLDIGCGWGFSLKINPEFWCVDADEACISHLQASGARAFFADVSGRLPFEDGFFDNAFTHDVLEHLEEEEMNTLFKEARRVLRRGGRFMNVVPNRKGYLMGLDPAIGHKRFIRSEEVSKAARQAGFELIKTWHTPLPGFLSEAFVHNKLVTVCRAI
jgi:cyclopropane fatty-acyl-phospholipid synthase-like methyltransferase